MIFKNLIYDIINNQEINDKEKIERIKKLFGNETNKDRFEDFWNLYKKYKKNIGIPKKEALYKFDLIINSGYKVEEIIYGLSNYLKICEMKGIETKYIIGVRRFLREKIFLMYQNKVEDKKNFYICSYGNKHNKGEICKCF